MDLRIISSNIRFDNPKDGNHQWAHRRRLLAEVLLSHDPHIICTQEGRSTQLKDFASLLPNYQLIDGHRDYLEERMYPCLFIKSELKVHLSGDIWLSKTPFVSGSKLDESAFPRLCTFAHIEFGQCNLFIVNTHLDHQDSSAREQQVNILIEEISKVLKGPKTSKDSLLMVAGDFNEGPKETVHQLLLQKLDLEDSWDSLQKKPGVTHHNFGRHIEYADRIDWVLSDKRMTPLEVYIDKTSKQGVFPSDHYPVLASYRLT